MTEATRTVFDPFHGKNVEISDRLTDRLRGKYACGPMLENGDPEFGWRQMEPTSINLEAAAEIERLQKELMEARAKTIEECAKIAESFAEVTGKIDGGMKSATAAAMWNIAKAMNNCKVMAAKSPVPSDWKRILAMSLRKS